MKPIIKQVSDIINKMDYRYVSLYLSIDENTEDFFNTNYSYFLDIFYKYQEKFISVYWNTLRNLSFDELCDEVSDILDCNIPTSINSENKLFLWMIFPRAIFTKNFIFDCFSGVYSGDDYLSTILDQKVKDTDYNVYYYLGILVNKLNNLKNQINWNIDIYKNTFSLIVEKEDKKEEIDIQVLTFDNSKEYASIVIDPFKFLGLNSLKYDLKERMKELVYLLDLDEETESSIYATI